MASPASKPPGDGAAGAAGAAAAVSHGFCPGISLFPVGFCPGLSFQEGGDFLLLQINKHCFDCIFCFLCGYQAGAGLLVCSVK